MKLDSPQRRPRSDSSNDSLCLRAYRPILGVEPVEKVSKNILGRDAEKSDRLECATINDLMLGRRQVSPEISVKTAKVTFSTGSLDYLEMLMIERGQQILLLAKAIQSTFSNSEWTEIGYITASDEWIESHLRLLRSLRWGDDDYKGHALDAKLSNSFR